MELVDKGHLKIASFNALFELAPPRCFGPRFLGFRLGSVQTGTLLETDSMMHARRSFASS